MPTHARGGHGFDAGGVPGRAAAEYRSLYCAITPSAAPGKGLPGMSRIVWPHWLPPTIQVRPAARYRVEDRRSHVTAIGHTRPVMIDRCQCEWPSTPDKWHCPAGTNLTHAYDTLQRARCLAANCLRCPPLHPPSSLTHPPCCSRTPGLSRPGWRRITAPPKASGSKIAKRGAKDPSVTYRRRWRLRSVGAGSMARRRASTRRTSFSASRRGARAASGRRSTSARSRRSSRRAACSRRATRRSRPLRPTDAGRRPTTAHARPQRPRICCRRWKRSRRPRPSLRRSTRPIATRSCGAFRRQWNPRRAPSGSPNWWRCLRAARRFTSSSPEPRYDRRVHGWSPQASSRPTVGFRPWVACGQRLLSGGPFKADQRPSNGRARRNRPVEHMRVDHGRAHVCMAGAAAPSGCLARLRRMGSKRVTPHVRWARIVDLGVPGCSATHLPSTHFSWRFRTFQDLSGLWGLTRR